QVQVYTVEHIMAAISGLDIDNLNIEITNNEIPGFDGVYANAIDLEICRDELEEVLEEWLFFRISRNLPVPTVNGVKLKINKIAV
ncbi:MAG: UDP-3-O-acyl-N-acetylglucosamine deacetylase, partial [Actinomycetia bacterium]|nr:UDP-3-O-acyl-N-acetylglucosamine deacetylase [Actinomycetes bacterium]